MKFHRALRYRTVWICVRCDHVHDVYLNYCEACGFGGDGRMVEHEGYSLAEMRHVKYQVPQNPALHIDRARPHQARCFPLFWRWRTTRWEIASKPENPVDQLIKSTSSPGDQK